MDYGVWENEMIPIGTFNGEMVILSLTNNPQDWEKQFLGLNETPLAYVVKGKVTKTLFGREIVLKGGKHV